MENKYNLKLITSFNEWEEIFDPWNNLLKESRSDTIFLTWQWLYTWADCYLDTTRKLFIIAIYEKEELVGVAPWYLNTISFGPLRLKQIFFLGNPETGADYLEVFTQKGKERDVALLLYRYLYNEKPADWDILNLKNIPSDSLFLLNFTESVKNAGKYYESQADAFCPYIKLPSNNEDFLNEISPNRKKRFKYDLNTLKKNGDVKHITISPIGDSSALCDFISIYKKRWVCNSKFITFLERFISISNSNEWTSIDFLKANDQSVAAQFNLKYNDTKYMYLMAAETDFNKKVSVGNVLTGLTIEKAIADGFTFFDFLKGTEEYKFYWTKDGKRSLNLVCYQRNLGAFIFHTRKTIKNMVKLILR